MTAQYEQKETHTITLTYMGRTLFRQGIGKKGPWKLYKLSLTSPDRDEPYTYSCFSLGGASTQLTELTEGQEYQFSYNQEMRIHAESGETYPSKTIFFIRDPNTPTTQQTTIPPPGAMDGLQPTQTMTLPPPTTTKGAANESLRNSTPETTRLITEMSKNEQYVTHCKQGLTQFLDAYAQARTQSPQGTELQAEDQERVYQEFLMIAGGQQ